MKYKRVDLTTIPTLTESGLQIGLKPKENGAKMLKEEREGVEELGGLSCFFFLGKKDDLFFCFFCFFFVVGLVLWDFVVGEIGRRVWFILERAIKEQKLGPGKKNQKVE